ncbi:MAG: ferredoxin [Mycobacteriales bacterium]
MKVGVDARACEANAICTGLAPEVFELDDGEVLHITVEDVPDSLAEQVRRAVDSCPKRALYLEQ